MKTTLKKIIYPVIVLFTIIFIAISDKTNLQSFILVNNYIVNSIIVGVVLILLLLIPVLVCRKKWMLILISIVVSFYISNSLATRVIFNDAIQSERIDYAISHYNKNKEILETLKTKHNLEYTIGLDSLRCRYLERHNITLKAHLDSLSLVDAKLNQLTQERDSIYNASISYDYHGNFRVFYHVHEVHWSDILLMLIIYVSAFYMVYGGLTIVRSEILENKTN